MSRVVVPDARQGPSALRSVQAPAAGWAILTWIGAAFVIIGVVDLGLAWYPTQFGVVDWEFGILAVTLDNLPLPALGLTLLVVAALSNGRAWQVGLATVVLALLVALLAAGFVIYLTTVPLALKAEVPVRFSVHKAIAKTTVQFLAYLVVFGVMAMKTRRVLRSGRSDASPSA